MEQKNETQESVKDIATELSLLGEYRGIANRLQAALKREMEERSRKGKTNCEREECDSCDHAAAVFAKETGTEMPENPSDASMILWMNSFFHWLFEEYNKEGTA